MSIPPDRMPKHPNRRRIIEFLKQSPGASLQDIADHLNVARNGAMHHVRVLIARDLVVQSKLGRRRVHFLPEVKHATHRSLLSMVRQRTVRRILEYLQHDSEASWRAVARDLDISPHTVRWHIGRLGDEGLIHVVSTDGGDGHRVYMHPDVHHLMGEDGEEALRRFRSDVSGRPDDFPPVVPLDPLVA